MASPRILADFCLWGAPKPNYGTVGDIEGEVVAYCTKKGHGTRLIPPGTLTAVYVPYQLLVLNMLHAGC